jgi:hypothetical protein
MLRAMSSGWTIGWPRDHKECDLRHLWSKAKSGGVNANSKLTMRRCSSNFLRSCQTLNYATEPRQSLACCPLTTATGGKRYRCSSHNGNAISIAARRRSETGRSRRGGTVRTLRRLTVTPCALAALLHDSWRPSRSVTRFRKRIAAGYRKYRLGLGARAIGLATEWMRNPIA